jgi:hypothetical protein
MQTKTTWRAAFVAALLALSSCVTIEPEPTLERPWLRCIQPTAKQASTVPGKLQPEIVRVIGRYEHDSSKLMVLRQGEADPKKWLPMDEQLLSRVNCGAQMDAFKELAGKEGDSLWHTENEPRK